MAGRRRWHAGRAETRPIAPLPGARSFNGIPGRAVRSDVPRSLPWAFDYFPELVAVPAAGALVRVPLMGAGSPVGLDFSEVCPDWAMGQIHAVYPYLSTAAGVLVGGPLIPGAGVVFRWRVKANEVPIHGLESIQTIRWPWGFYSPEPIGFFKAGESLSADVLILDPAAVYLGGLVGIRIVGRIVPLK